MISVRIKSFDITAGGIQAAEDTVTLAMQKMADEVKEKSGGTITITVSPAAQLGDATSQMEQYLWEPRRCSWMPDPGSLHL